MEDRTRKPGEGPEKPPCTAVPIQRQEVHQGRAGEAPDGLLKTILVFGRVIIDAALLVQTHPIHLL
jgi:hypothetical protein